MSLKLQAAFGLRREESIKIRPEWADRGDRLALKASWTKGGREREIPIRTAEQRLVLDEAKQLAVRGSLIPKASSYVQQLQRFKAQCMAAGIQHVHGHRHQYAQDRYRVLTGWACPAQGGPTSKQLTYEQKAIDRQVVLLGRRSRQSIYDLMRRAPSFPRVELNGLDAVERRRRKQKAGG